MRSLTQPRETFENDLATSISGYGGYQIANDRSKTDRRLREFLSEKLKQIERDLSLFGLKIHQHKNNAFFEPFDRIALSLKVLIQSLENPTYLQAAFFNQKPIDPLKLSQLYEQEMQLVNQVGILVEEVRNLDTITDEYEIEDILNYLFDLIDGVNQTMSEREFLILGGVE